MDTLDKYREVTERILTEVARITPSTDDVVYKIIIDRKTDSYGLIAVGWEKKRRVHHFVIHLEMINGKIWIQEDNTDLVIADELERAGIPKSDIVLGFQPPSVRPYTEYAAA